MPRSLGNGVLLGLAALILTSGLLGQGPPAPVFVANAVRQQMTELRPVVGNLRAVRRAKVASIESGRVAEVFVEVGAEVEAGDRLAKLDTRRLDLSLSEARESVNALTETVRERKAGLERAKADLESIRVALDESPGAVSAQALRTAETDVEQAAARLEVAKGELRQAEIRRDLLDVRVTDAEIRAPFAGAVVRRSVEPGEWLASGGEVVTLVSTGVHEAWIEVDERFDFGALARLEQVRVRIDSTGEELMSKRVRLIGDVDPRSRRGTLIADLEPNGSTLAPGLSVTAQVPTGEMVERLLLPNDALVRDSGGSFVYVVRSNGSDQSIAMPVNVTLLYGVDAETVVCEASAPIQDGEAIVVEGNERLRPFSPVDPRPAGSKSGSGKSR